MPNLQPIGGEILVASPDGRQEVPTIARLENGRFIIVWNEDSVSGTLVRGQLLDASWQQIGGAFTIGASNSLDLFELRPAVIALDGGGFAVTWTEAEAVSLSIYDGDANVIADTIRVADSDAEESAGIVQLDDGTIVLSYQSQASDGETDFVRFRRYGSDGTALDSEVTIFQESHLLEYTAIAALEDGGFVITWHGFEDDTGVIRARLFNADGSARGDPFVVHGSGDGGIRAAVTGLAGGGFVIAWSRLQADDFDVVARRFDSDGDPLGSTFLVNETSDGFQAVPALNALDNGGFIVTWVSGTSSFENYDV